jgi:predicted O-methyltransferase YrrM
MELIIIRKDRIYYKNNPSVVIMDEIETPLMQKFAEIVTQNGGNILEVGFGMGISANFIYNSKINSYTCIETHSEIYENALEWAKDKSNVNIILGDWLEIIPTLTNKFDGIFMDTFEFKNYQKFEEYCKKISNVGCVLSIFDYMTQNNKSLEFETVEIANKIDYFKNNNRVVNLYYTYFNGESFGRKTKPIKFL